MKTEVMNNPVSVANPNIMVFRSQSRGQADYGWLKTRYSFSFANYYNKDRMHFGALRVLNDDIIDGGMGFDLHPHDNMEIVTIPLFGALRHQDSMGHTQVISPNEVQVMSAGTGLFHAEFNTSETERTGLFQIWIIPEQRNVKPVYNQTAFDETKAQGAWQLLVGPVGSGSELTIHQQAYISRIFLKTGEVVEYQPQSASYGSFVMVAEGEVEIDHITLQLRDAAGVINQGAFEVKALKDSYIINIEVPDLPKI